MIRRDPGGEKISHFEMLVMCVCTTTWREGGGGARIKSRIKSPSAIHKLDSHQKSHWGGARIKSRIGGGGGGARIKSRIKSPSAIHKLDGGGEHASKVALGGGARIKSRIGGGGEAHGSRIKSPSAIHKLDGGGARIEVTLNHPLPYISSTGGGGGGEAIHKPVARSPNSATRGSDELKLRGAILMNWNATPSFLLV